MRSVGKTREFDRIVALPLRTTPPEGTDQLTEVLRSPDGRQNLRPIQAQALAELCCCRGLLGPIRVGAGKTLISFLAPRMVEAKRPLLLVPAKLRKKTQWEFSEFQAHWTPGVVPVVLSYELLGRMQSAEVLDHMKPDLIIVDEAHKLKNVKAAVTRRVGRYMSNNPDTMFVALSGTMTQRSLMNFAHMSEWSLGEGSPLPRDLYDLNEWAMALDERSVWQEVRCAGVLHDLHPKGLGPRDKFQRRFEETPGVVIAPGKGIGTSLIIDRWEHGVELCPELRDAFHKLNTLWETSDGNPLISAVEVWRHAVELSQGFWYRWEPKPPEEWLEVRRVWSAFVRQVLSHSPILDSPAQVEDRYQERPEYIRWRKIHDTYKPTTVTEWITKTYVRRAAQWAREEGGIVWVEHNAVGKALQAEGIPYYGSMGQNNQGQLIEKAKGGIAASIAANSEGRNLQTYHKNLILSPPTTGSRWEQTLGRTHREGQQADEVIVEVMLDSPQAKDSFRQALSDAKYQRQITGSEQKLLLADILFA